MKRIAPAVLLVLSLSGCATKVVKTTEVHRPDTQTLAYQEFLVRRTEELRRMGGPFNEPGVAENKAREEATARYGDIPPEVSTTWSWGKQAGRRQAQAEVNSTLEKMERDASRP